MKNRMAGRHACTRELENVSTKVQQEERRNKAIIIVFVSILLEPRDDENPTQTPDPHLFCFTQRQGRKTKDTHCGGGFS